MTMPFPIYHATRARCLNGVWSFAFLGDLDGLGDLDDVETFDPSGVRCNDVMAVPGVYDASPTYAGTRGVALYRTSIEIEPGREAQLRFDGLGLWARLFIDRQPVEVHDLPYSGWSVRVPPSDHRRRQIDLLIDNRLHPARTVLVEPYFDFYLYGGVYRDVWCRELAGPAVEQARVTVLDRDTGKIAVAARTFDPMVDDVPLRIALDGGDFITPTDVAVDGNSVRFEATVPQPKAWSPAEPNLHTLTLCLGDDRFTTRFGLRDIRVDGPRLLLNDEPLQLHGVCRHEACPQVGPALSDAQIVHDLQRLKQLGCNFVRGSHYPQSPRFLDLCDEMGLLVFEESLGWQPRIGHFNNPHFVDQVEKQTRRMIDTSFNHPSVIMWGFLNEGDSHTPDSQPVYRRIVNAIREEDPTRPVTFASNHPFDERNFDLADVISVNTYPGWYADEAAGPSPLKEIVPAIDRILDHLAASGLSDRPFLISEIGAGAIYGWHDPLRNHWTEGYQADLIETVLRKVRDDDRVTGVALWQFCDGRTYADSQALRRPRSFNNKGVFDEYRRPKLAAGVIRQYWSIDTGESLPPH